MNAPWADWTHVVKIDPDKSLRDGETFADVCETGTDAIAIGGTTGMTRENVADAIEACGRYDIPLYQEPSNPSVVIEDDALEGYLIPTVLNAGDPFWVTGAHKEWVRMADIDWTRTTTEAYVVLNPDSAVAAYTEADCDQSPGDVAAYAEVAERMFGQDIVYVEYSGTYGDPEVVAAARDALSEATLFYGGGIHDYQTAYEMGQRADTVVVGNLLYEEGVDAVRETVEGATEAATVGAVS